MRYLVIILSTLIWFFSVDSYVLAQTSTARTTSYRQPININKPFSRFSQSRAIYSGLNTRNNAQLRNHGSIMNQGMQYGRIDANRRIQFGSNQNFAEPKRPQYIWQGSKDAFESGYIRGYNSYMRENNQSTRMTGYGRVGSNSYRIIGNTSGTTTNSSRSVWRPGN